MNHHTSGRHLLLLACTYFMKQALNTFSGCLLLNIIFSSSSPSTHFLILCGSQYWGWGVLHRLQRRVSSYRGGLGSTGDVYLCVNSLCEHICDIDAPEWPLIHFNMSHGCLMWQVHCVVTILEIHFGPQPSLGTFDDPILHVTCTLHQALLLGALRGGLTFSHAHQFSCMVTGWWWLGGGGGALNQTHNALVVLELLCSHTCVQCNARAARGSITLQQACSKRIRALCTTRCVQSEGPVRYAPQYAAAR